MEQHLVHVVQTSLFYPKFMIIWLTVRIVFPPPFVTYVAANKEIQKYHAEAFA